MLCTLYRCHLDCYVLYTGVNWTVMYFIQVPFGLFCSLYRCHLDCFVLYAGVILTVMTLYVCHVDCYVLYNIKSVATVIKLVV